MTRLVLASASPRRRELLAAAGVAFDVRPSAVDESIDATREPRAAALELARRKWSASSVTLAVGEIALAADTVVGLERDGAWTLLGKPDDEREARAMLAALAGSRHLVATGVAAGARGTEPRSGVAGTFVTMRALAPREIDAYVASGEWRDKAGGYAIQESADRFVTALEGDGFDNVVGLPVALALRLAAEAGHTPAREALERLDPPAVRWGC